MGEENTRPNPGTKEAIEMGCICPVMDNEYGRGYMGQEGVFVFCGGCPIHKIGEEAHSNDEEE